MGRKDIYTVQIEEGKWYKMGAYDHTECCDCGLVHKEEFKIEKGSIYFRTFRDDKLTAKRRLENGIEIKKSKQ